MSKYLSYAQFVKDRKNFKQAGRKSGGEFNLFDNPSHKYFKLLFYFGSNADKETNLTSASNGGQSSGLLAPTWNVFNMNSDKNDYYNYNSAWAYLKMNDENERAAMLEQFVTLLSNINTYSPWYFQTVGGLAEALERKPAESDKFEIGDTKKLTITCLPDAFDNRIGTLLELYRSIVWSWVQKKEIIPSNLRKFDMAVYIFESPIANWHKDDDNDYDSLDDTVHRTSYKMLEFHDCEFNYNSIKSGLNELNNQEGFSPTYTIEISYNDCYEISYNELAVQAIGDIIQTDTQQSVMADGVDIITQERTIQQSGILSNAIKQVAGHLVADVKHVIKRAVLGNIHTFSLTQIRDQVSDLMEGNIIKTGMTVAQYIKSGQQRAAMKNKRAASGNIFPITEITDDEPKQKPSGDIFPEPELSNKKPSGNIFN